MLIIPVHVSQTATQLDETFHQDKQPVNHQHEVIITIVISIKSKNIQFLQTQPKAQPTPFDLTIAIWRLRTAITLKVPTDSLICQLPPTTSSAVYKNL